MTDVTEFQGFILGVGSGESGALGVREHQGGVYAMVSQPADFIYQMQAPILTVAASETSSGLFQVQARQLGVYVLVRPNADRRELRAWTFVQDDHIFYGIQLGNSLTLVYDKATQTWSQWRSPGKTYWRVEDATDWEGMNLGCDTSTGIIWEIDPTGRLDEGTTPITSIINGGFTKRFRKEDPCYMAELALSEGSPPSVDASTLSITLRTSDDGGRSYFNHGAIIGEALGEDISVRWYGLGLMNHPNRIFEITDTGYARRIDGLDIEIGGSGA